LSLHVRPIISVECDVDTECIIERIVATWSCAEDRSSSI